MLNFSAASPTEPLPSDLTIIYMVIDFITVSNCNTRQMENYNTGSTIFRQCSPSKPPAKVTNSAKHPGAPVSRGRRNSALAPSPAISWNTQALKGKRIISSGIFHLGNSRKKLAQMNSLGTEITFLASLQHLNLVNELLLPFNDKGKKKNVTSSPLTTAPTLLPFHEPPHRPSLLTSQFSSQDT